MYNQGYNEYIRSILGYPNYNEQDYYQDYNYYSQTRSSELEECYPEIYKVVYPMVKMACQRMNEPATKEKISEMVNELYANIEGNANINITIENRGSGESKKETRQFNKGLSDLIRILLIRELLGKPSFPPPPPGRPPFPPPPGRPPYRNI